MFDINGWEFLILLVVGIVVLGPERLPEYAAKLARLVRQVKGMADNAREQLKEQLGPDLVDVDWARYDPGTTPASTTPAELSARGQHRAPARTG